MRIEDEIKVEVEIEETITVATNNETTSTKKINCKEEKEDEEVITQLIG